MYTLTGTVIHGKGNGRKVGMPTANLYYAEGAKLPERGVYGVRARIDGKWYPGVTNVGTRPSVDDDPRMTVETFLPGEDMDLYGREMTIEFHIFLQGDPEVSVPGGSKRAGGSGYPPDAGIL